MKWIRNRGGTCKKKAKIMTTRIKKHSTKANGTSQILHGKKNWNYLHMRIDAQNKNHEFAYANEIDSGREWLWYDHCNLQLLVICLNHAMEWKGALRCHVHHCNNEILFQLCIPGSFLFYVAKTSAKQTICFVLFQKILPNAPVAQFLALSFAYANILALFGPFLGLQLGPV